MVKLAMTADNKAAVNKLSKEKTVIGLMTDTDTELLASSRASSSWSAPKLQRGSKTHHRGKREDGKIKNPSERGKFLLHFHRFFAILF